MIRYVLHNHDIYLSNEQIFIEPNYVPDAALVPG